MPGAEESISEVSGKEVLGNSHWLLEMDDHLPPTNSCVQLYMPQQARFTASWGNSSRTQQRGGLPLSVCVFLCLYQSVSQSVYEYSSPCVSLFVHLHTCLCLSPCLTSVCLFVPLPICGCLSSLSVYLCIYLLLPLSLSLFLSPSVPPLRLTANII